MKCRACGAEIAEKAIVCYRCGAPTAEAAARAPGATPRRSRPHRALLAAALAMLMIAVALGLWRPGDIRLMATAGLAAGVLAVAAMRRR